ncbi:type II secretion system F family protein [Brenneria rubrifaciens]|uniref:Type II secretion system F family protein n=1 Tax=Brenneria rubrifaciens TaxID=55213 RepID=A0A4P8QQS4_9GAMM|nr:type II secretion system F family protein [Brenneria rubrifaciens]QCR07600.1 type II secretion system F family protein [Brenneria rubrifaciens]
MDLLYVTCLLCAVTGVALYLYARVGRRARLAERLQAEVLRKRSQLQEQVDSWRHHALPQRVLRILQRIGHFAPLFSAAQRTEIAGKLVSAGFRSPQALIIVAALSLLSMVSLGLLVAFFAWPYLEGNWIYALALILLAIYLGTLFPRLLLDRMVLRRQRLIQQSLPDALDLLVICTNAGLGLNSALQRVAEEMEMVCPALGDELRLTSGELQISSDTETVLNRLVERTRLDSIRTLVNTLLQSRQYGTAITQALRVLARSERTARMMRLEEAAAKLAVKITLPMMLFIMPTVLIVAAGPAVLGLMAFFATQQQ